MKKYKLAVVGATGVVGQKMIDVLLEKHLPISEYCFFASSRSAGKTIRFGDDVYLIKELTESSFNEDFDFALFSAGSETSLKYSPIAVEHGCIVIDNSSAFRMDENVPLVVPEVNPKKIFENKGIIEDDNQLKQFRNELKRIYEENKYYLSKEYEEKCKQEHAGVCQEYVLSAFEKYFSIFDRYLENPEKFWKESFFDRKRWDAPIYKTISELCYNCCQHRYNNIFCNSL